ncbi:hypothetical protein yc1106_07024 [Curvularia clavata]|uniref:aldehyde dehydrogenase (NAD(+)) n=1 Tax=Curvularia clavata TaxID=95742 RepID=A0A9Q9DV79_CURCL|nr:hypothetical protein yc1106_07024 [Curvularia clavata]
MSTKFDLNRYPIPNKLFIHGKWVDSKGGKIREFTSIVSGQSICKETNGDVKDVQWANAEDVDAAVESATKGLEAWQATSKVQKKSLLLNFAKLVREHTDELNWLESILVGKASGFGRFELNAVFNTIEYYATLMDKFPGETASFDDKTLKYTYPQPYGVCAAILPFNGPLMCAGMKLSPALAAGNVIILKTSDTNPFSCLRLAELAIEAGIPPGVVNCITGHVESGHALSSHMKIRKISFTGGIAVGKQVQIAAAKSNLKSVTLELGGKSPVIVFPDADLDKAAQMCTYFLTLNGQGGALPTRAYIHESIFDDVLSRVKAVAQSYHENMRSDPLLEKTFSMPLFHARQRDIVRSYIEMSKKEATMIVDGCPEDPSDPYIGPTIFTNPLPTAKILREEIFGPVLVICAFNDTEKVIELANDSEYGLGAFVCTKDIGIALQLANRLEAGSVGINSMPVSNDIPFGGWKQSGQNAENGLEGYRDWFQLKTVVMEASLNG